MNQNAGQQFAATTDAEHVRGLSDRIPRLCPSEPARVHQLGTFCNSQRAAAYVVTLHVALHLLIEQRQGWDGGARSHPALGKRRFMLRENRGKNSATIAISGGVNAGREIALGDALI